jgi:crotonobetainyl-CoA:carnitine CoA-transferase CaiB-like acyl-CoA transferase
MKVFFKRGFGTVQKKEKASKRILEGYRVIDASRILVGAFGSMMLADMGAEVIKIE